MKILLIFWIIYGIIVHALLQKYNPQMKKSTFYHVMDFIIPIVLGPIGTLIFFKKMIKNNGSTKTSN